jgi:hypothetical protein
MKHQKMNIKKAIFVAILNKNFRHTLFNIAPTLGFRGWRGCKDKLPFLDSKILPPPPTTTTTTILGACTTKLYLQCN